ncbi:hypothetical protein AHF37_09986 [Paragonimus kellicotti]|nr:hypothetical protein AHF37_09986 [Paragonimus kellicotti]
MQSFLHIMEEFQIILRSSQLPCLILRYTSC